MTWPVGLGLLRAPQAPVVEGGIASGSHIPEGTHPPSPERFTSGSLSTRATSKADRSLGSPTLATGSVQRQDLCNPLLLGECFNVPESRLEIRSGGFFRFPLGGYFAFPRGLMTLISMYFKCIGGPSALNPLRSLSGNAVYRSPVQPSINGWKVVSSGSGCWMTPSLDFSKE